MSSARPGGQGAVDLAVATRRRLLKSSAGPILRLLLHNHPLYKMEDFSKSREFQEQARGRNISGVAAVTQSQKDFQGDIRSYIPGLQTDLYERLKAEKLPEPPRFLAHLTSILDTLLAVKVGCGRTHGDLRLDSIIFCSPEHDLGQRAPDLPLLTDFPGRTAGAPPTGVVDGESEDLRHLGLIIILLAGGARPGAPFNVLGLSSLPAARNPLAKARFGAAWPQLADIARDLLNHKVPNLEEVARRLCALSGESLPQYEEQRRQHEQATVAEKQRKAEEARRAREAEEDRQRRAEAEIQRHRLHQQARGLQATVASQLDQSRGALDLLQQTRGALEQERGTLERESQAEDQAWRRAINRGAAEVEQAQIAQAAIDARLQPLASSASARQDRAHDITAEIRRLRNEGSLKSVDPDLDRLARQAEALAGDTEAAGRTYAGGGRALFARAHQLCREVEAQIRPAATENRIQELTAPFEPVLLDTTTAIEGLDVLQKETTAFEQRTSDLLGRVERIKKVDPAETEALTTDLEALAREWDNLEVRARESLALAEATRAKALEFRARLSENQTRAIGLHRTGRMELEQRIKAAVTAREEAFAQAEKTVMEAEATDHELAARFHRLVQDFHEVAQHGLDRQVQDILAQVLPLRPEIEEAIHALETAGTTCLQQLTTLRRTAQAEAAAEQKATAHCQAEAQAARTAQGELDSRLIAAGEQAGDQHEVLSQIREKLRGIEAHSLPEAARLDYENLTAEAANLAGDTEDEVRVEAPGGPALYARATDLCRKAEESLHQSAVAAQIEALSPCLETILQDANTQIHGLQSIQAEIFRFEGEASGLLDQDAPPDQRTPDKTEALYAGLDALSTAADALRQRARKSIDEAVGQHEKARDLVASVQAQSSHLLEVARPLRASAEGLIREAAAERRRADAEAGRRVPEAQAAARRQAERLNQLQAAFRRFTTGEIRRRAEGAIQTGQSLRVEVSAALENLPRCRTALQRELVGIEQQVQEQHEAQEAALARCRDQDRAATAWQRELEESIEKVGTRLRRHQEKTLAIRRELKAWKTDPSLRRVRRETVALDQEAERLANQAETAIEANRGHGKDLFTPCMDLCRRAEERLNQTKIAEALQESKARFEVLSRETDGTAEALQESQEKLHQIEREAGAILKQTTPTGETTEAAPGTLEAEIEALSLRFDPLRTRVRESLDQAIRIRSDADHLSTDLGRDREGALRAANDARHEAGALLDQAVAEWRRVLTVAEKLATDADAGEEQVRLLLKGLQTRHEKLRETVIALHRAARGRLWKRLATVGAIALILGSAWWWIYRNRAHARRVANVAQQVEESLRSDNLSGALERVLGSGLDPADQRDFTNALAQALEFPDIGVQELLPGQTRRVKLEPQPPTTSRFRKALRNVTWTVPAYLSHNSVTVEATRTNFTCADPNGLELTLTAGLRSEVSIGRTNSFQLPVTNALVPDGALTIRFQVTENVPPTITVREDDARDRTALTDYQTLKRTAPASLRLAVSVEDKTLPKETNASVIDGRWRLPPRLTADHIMANTATSLVLTNLPPGTYSLELQATDGALTSTFHLTVEVAESGDQLAVRAFDDAKAAAGRDSFDEARAKLRNISDLDSLREDIRSNVTAWLRDLESPPELLNDTLSLPYGATTNLMEYIRDNLRDQTALGRTSWSITPLDPPDSDPSNYRARTNVELSFQLRFAPNWAKTTNRSLSIKVTPTATEESLKEALERLRDPRESAAEVYRALLGLTSDAMREEEAARLSTTLAVFANLQLEGPDSVDVLAGETGSVELAVSQWPFNALPPAWRLALTPNTPSNGPQAKEMTVTYTPPPESGDVEVSVEVVAIEAGAEDVTPRLQTQPRPLRFKVGMNQPPEIEDLPKSAETTESTWTRKFRAHDPEDHPLQWPAMSANVKVTNAPSGEGYEVTVERIQPGTNTVFLTASDGVRTNRFTIEIMRILGEPLGGDFGLQWVPDLPNSNGVWPGEKVKGGWMATNWITVSQLDRPSLDSPEVPPEPAECTKEKAEEYVKQISVAAEAGLPGGWKVIIATKDQLKQEENNLPLGKYFWARDTTELQIFHLFGGKIIPGTDLTQAQQLGRFRIAVVHP